MNSHFILKFVVGGDGGVGKTTHMCTFVGNPYGDNDLTKGVDFHIKKVKINGVIKILQVWDLGGEDQFRFLLPSFLKEAQGFLLGFDIFRHKTYVNLPGWLNIFREACPQAPIVLVGYKFDKGYHPVLNKKRALEFVDRFNLNSYVEVSSKANMNVELPFKMLLETLTSELNESVQIKFLSTNET